MNDRGIVTLASPHSFTGTVGRLLSALESHAVKVFAVIDQQAEARGAGLAMPPTTLIVFGNPKGGTPLMLAQASAGLDLPLKVLVTEAEPGKVEVRFNSAAYIVERHALPAALENNIAPALKILEGALKE